MVLTVRLSCVEGGPKNHRRPTGRAAPGLCTDAKPQSAIPVLIYRRHQVAGDPLFRQYRKGGGNNGFLHMPLLPCCDNFWYQVQLRLLG